MDLPIEVRQRFREYGSVGGRRRAGRLSASDRRRIACLASIARWTRERFASASFEDAGLPGGALVDAGLQDAAAGTESVASLLVAMARARLRREGVSVPRMSVPDPERRLFRRLEVTHGELAHARYRALRQQMVSFANACPLARQGGSRRVDGKGAP